MIKTTDGTMVKRTGQGQPGDRYPATGFKPLRATYTSVSGGETSINLALLSPSLQYVPGNAQVEVRRSSGGSLISGVDFYETSSTTIGFPDALIAGEIVEITLRFMVTGVMACNPRPDVYSTTATTGQTLVTATFSWTCGLNSGAYVGGVMVYVQGILAKRGVDYTEVAISGATLTNQIQFVDGCVGGEDIILIPTYQAIDTSAAQSSFNGQALQNLQNLMSAGTQGFVDQSTDMISVPNTAIVGRAKIPNLANDLRASLGVERIITQSIVQLQTEFGPNGEPVWAALNDDRGLIRFVGSWAIANTNSIYGLYQQTAASNTTDYVEVTFYGTGLNILSLTNAAAPAMSCDGGSETSLTAMTGGATILGARNYSTNTVFSAVSGLSLGVHTVKIRSTNQLMVYGFEILNANASGLVNINPGVGYLNGQKYVNSLVDSVAYNTGVTGSRGGRVVRYLNADGTVGQAFTAVDAAAAYLTSANHTNEDVVRTYHWREFGAGRADDFSLLPGTYSARAFTLDDGTTTLASSGAQAGASNGFNIQGGASHFVTLTFVGTGLDITNLIAGSGFTDTIYVDGTSVGTLTGLTVISGKLKIASGLAYGAHTVKIQRASGSALEITNFIVYQPKKPTLPATALEICDYNVMATYAAATTSGNALGVKSTGVLSKAISAREGVYVGAGWALASGASFAPGLAAYTSTTNDYLQYTFFGTGFDFRYLANTDGATSVLVSLQNVSAGGSMQALTSANFASLTASTYGVTGKFNTSTGVLDQTGGANVTECGLSVSNLPLAVYTVKLLKQAGGTYFRVDEIEPITPIHAVKSNLYADLQNTLPVGSCSMTDSRKTSLLPAVGTSQKAWAQAVGVASGPTVAVTSFVPVPDLSLTVTSSGKPLEISYAVNVYANPIGSSPGACTTCVYVNGVAASPTMQLAFSVTGLVAVLSENVIVPVGAGVHKIDVYWKSNNVGNTMYADAQKRSLKVREI